MEFRSSAALAWSDETGREVRASAKRADDMGLAADDILNEPMLQGNGSEDFEDPDLGKMIFVELALILTLATLIT